MKPSVEVLLNYLKQALGGQVLGVYLFGSAAVGGLRPDSDIDVLVVVRRSLSRRDRSGLVELLLELSGRRATVTPGRALEVTALVLEDVVSCSYPPVCEFLYGEWLRDEFLGGRVPQRHSNPDLAVLVKTVRQHAISLHGPRPGDLLPPVPVEDLHRSIDDGLSTSNHLTTAPTGPTGEPVEEPAQTGGPATPALDKDRFKPKNTAGQKRPVDQGSVRHER